MNKWYEIRYLFREELFGDYFMFAAVVEIANQFVESGVHESFVLNGPR